MVNVRRHDDRNIWIFRLVVADFLFYFVVLPSCVLLLLPPHLSHLSLVGVVCMSAVLCSCVCSVFNLSLRLQLFVTCPVCLISFWIIWLLDWFSVFIKVLFLFLCLHLGQFFFYHTLFFISFQCAISRISFMSHLFTQSTSVTYHILQY